MGALDRLPRVTAGRPVRAAGPHTLLLFLRIVDIHVLTQKGTMFDFVARAPADTVRVRA